MVQNIIYFSSVKVTDKRQLNIYVYKDRIWRWMTYKGWYAIKPKQPTNQLKEKSGKINQLIEDIFPA